MPQWWWRANEVELEHNRQPDWIVNSGWVQFKDSPAVEAQYASNPGGTGQILLGSNQYELDFGSQPMQQRKVGAMVVGMSTDRCRRCSQGTHATLNEEMEVRSQHPTK